jgi:hypothetical protein
MERDDTDRKERQICQAHKDADDRTSAAFVKLARKLSLMCKLQNGHLYYNSSIKLGCTLATVNLGNC